MPKCDACSKEITESEMATVPGATVVGRTAAGFVPSRVASGPLGGLAAKTSLSQSAIWSQSVRQNASAAWGFCAECHTELERFGGADASVCAKCNLGISNPSEAYAHDFALLKAGVVSVSGGTPGTFKRTEYELSEPIWIRLYLCSSCLLKMRTLQAATLASFTVLTGGGLTWALIAGRHDHPQSSLNNWAGTAVLFLLNPVLVIIGLQLFAGLVKEHARFKTDKSAILARWRDGSYTNTFKVTGHPKGYLLERAQRSRAPKMSRQVALPIEQCETCGKSFPNKYYEATLMKRKCLECRGS